MRVFKVDLSSEDVEERMVAIPAQRTTPVTKGERVLVRGQDGETFLGTVVNRVPALGDLVVRLSVRLPQPRQAPFIPAQRVPA